MNIANVIARIQRQFGDESGVQVTEADILRWINDAQNEAILQHNNLLMTSSTVATVVNQQAYNLPAGLLDVKAIRYTKSPAVSSYPLEFLTTQELDEYIGDWIGTEYLGEPEYFTRGANQTQFRVFPVPDHALGTFTLEYSRYANDVVDSSSVIDLPVYYHPYVIEFCLMKAFEMDEEWDAMDRKAAYVQSTLDANFGRDEQFGKGTYPVVTTTNEDYV